jgi:hypothetical protein
MPRCYIIHSFFLLFVLLTVKYHFVIIAKSGCIDGNVLLILYAKRCCHTQLVIYVCFVATSTSIWITLLCNWMPYEQVT